MNMSRVVSALVMKNGLYNISSPFKNKVTGEQVPVENVVQETLTVITIPEYSEFVPWKRETTVDWKNLKCLDRQSGIYVLPPYLTITPVKYVLNVHPPFMNTRGTYGDIAPAYGINRSVQGVATSQAYMMLAGQMRAEPTFEYLGDNKIRLYGWPKIPLVFEVACEHEPNGETIPDSCYDSFMELAQLDLGIVLYENLKYYNEIPSAFGQINLKIDKYQSYEADRNALLDRWRDTFHLDVFDGPVWM